MWGKAALVATAVVALVLGTAAETRLAAHAGFAYSLGDAMVGWSFVAAGLIAWSHRPMNRSGVLMVLVGFLWFVGNLRWMSHCQVAVLWTAGQIGVDLFAAVLLHLLLAFPEGRLSRRGDRFLVAAAYVDVTVVVLVLEFFHRVPSGFGCATLPAHLNLVLVRADAGLYSWGEGIRLGLNVGLGLVVSGLLYLRWKSASRPTRRLIAPLLVAGAAASLAVTVGAASEYALAANRSLPGDLLTLMRDAGLCSIPFGFLVGLLRTGGQRSVVGDLVISLGQHPSQAGVREALGRALGDPSLRVGYWVPSEQAYVDELNRRLDLPSEDSPVVATEIRLDGDPVAVLVHDPALRQTPRLVEAVAAAARMSLENERLHAEVRAQLERVRASRARIVAAADAERRRLERDLHDGAQQRLVSVGLAMRRAREELGSQPVAQVAASLSDADEQLRLALVELRDLARGIHPAVLTEEGLASALEGLAERVPIPVKLHVGSIDRLPSAVEAAAYFVASEALANVVKHAHASGALVSVSHRDGRLRMEVTDDGEGGADPASGSGLPGLEDRVAALAGSLRVESTVGIGTRIMAEIPCES